MHRVVHAVVTGPPEGRDPDLENFIDDCFPDGVLKEDLSHTKSVPSSALKDPEPKWKSPKHKGDAEVIRADDPRASEDASQVTDVVRLELFLKRLPDVCIEHHSTVCCAWATKALRRASRGSGSSRHQASDAPRRKPFARFREMPIVSRASRCRSIITPRYVWIPRSAAPIEDEDWRPWPGIRRQAARLSYGSLRASGRRPRGGV